MKTYINEMSGECSVTLTETVRLDECTEVVDIKPIKKAVEALETLGKEITGLYVQYVHVDLDSKYYRRFPEDTVNKIYKRIYRGAEQKVFLENNRLYFLEDGHKIACPRGMHSYHGKNNTLEIVIRWRKTYEY